MEIFFTLFYLSGLIKSFFIYYHINLPIDFTLLTSFLLFFGLIHNYFGNKIPLLFNKKNLLAFLFLLVFFLWLLITLLYTPSHDYAYDKSILFIPNIIAFIFPLAIKDFNVKKFIKIISIVIPSLTLIFLVIFVNHNINNIESAAYDAIKGLYLVCATLLGINVLVLISSKEPIFESVFVNTIIVLSSIVLMFIVGARGPLLFVIALLFIFYVIKFIRVVYFGKFSLGSMKIALSGFVMSVVLIGVYFIYMEEVNYLIHRALVRLSLIVPTDSGGDMGDSVNTRVEQLELSVKLITHDLYHSIFGYGIGSFGLLNNGIDGRSYPHNIFLEIWVELGIVGLILFFGFLFFVFTKNNKNVRNITLFVLVYLILNSLKSNSFIDIRVYFAIFGMYMMKSNSNAISDSHNTT